MITLQRLRMLRALIADFDRECVEVEREMLADPRNDPSGVDVAPVVGTRATGALRRRSMDLTRELADLRNPSKWDKR